MRRLLFAIPLLLALPLVSAADAASPLCEDRCTLKTCCSEACVVEHPTQLEFTTCGDAGAVCNMSPRCSLEPIFP